LLAIESGVIFRASFDEVPLMDTPQFQTAQYASRGKDACKGCGQPIRDSYYRIKSDMVCAACAEKFKLTLPTDSHAAFVRAVIFGIGGAIVGLVLYAAFEIATHLIIGYVALAVGFIVAKAMMTGSNGFGGRRYQIVAVILTYAAVSIAAIPVYIYEYSQHHNAARQQQTTQTYDPTQDSTSSAPTQVEAPATPRKPVGIGAAIVTLVGLGLASPFLELYQGVNYSSIIGLVILFVGLRIAWRMTAGHPGAQQLVGPFPVNAPSS
jgi:hypothetical protein